MRTPATIAGAYLVPGGDFLVGLVGDQLVAMGALRPSAQGRGELKRMRVDPGSQRRGYGQLILPHLERRAQELGYSVLYLDTTTLQHAAIAFYEHNHYRQTGRGRRGSFDLVVFEKHLGEDPLAKYPDRVPVTTWYLEMRRAGDLRPARPPRIDGAIVERVEDPSPQLSRSFYHHVGHDWMWTDRLAWSDDDWQKSVQRVGYELWVAYVHGNLAGYIELDGAAAGDVEVAYLGLLPTFIGSGIGGRLLTVGVRRAWERGAGRVWVHTCSLDSPHARPNYEARGFVLYDTVISEREPPDDIKALRTAPPPQLAR
jgi:GNAT superfamily N-acetyltransferase